MADIGTIKEVTALPAVKPIRQPRTLPDWLNPNKETREPVAVPVKRQEVSA